MVFHGSAHPTPTPLGTAEKFRAILTAWKHHQGDTAEYQGFKDFTETDEYLAWYDTAQGNADYRKIWTETFPTSYMNLYDYSATMSEFEVRLREFKHEKEDGQNGTTQYNKLRSFTETQSYNDWYNSTDGNA